MECTKKSFASAQEAEARALEIHKENKLNGNQRKGSKPMRPYKCDLCGSYHLTSQTKHQYRFQTDVNYRRSIRKSSFIKRMTSHWEMHFSRKKQKERTKAVTLGQLENGRKVGL